MEAGHCLANGHSVRRRVQLERNGAGGPVATQHPRAAVAPALAPLRKLESAHQLLVLIKQVMISADGMGFVLRH